MWGYTLLGFDGGEIYSSDPEFMDESEATKEMFNHMDHEVYAGSGETWEGEA